MKTGYTILNYNSDYYSFGSLMPSRNGNANQYRYSIIGQEKTDEISGSGNHTTALFWEYDTRLGRRWNLDPVDHINASNYSCFANNPVFYVDYNGQFPWAFWFRSFISAPTVGYGSFKGDARGPSLNTGKITSRIVFKYVYEGSTGVVSKKNIRSSKSVFVGAPDLIPQVTAYGKPRYQFEDEEKELTPMGNIFGTVRFHYWGKDPITPSLFTPEIDIHGTVLVVENMETGILEINGTLDGDEFPSTEAFVADASGNKLFLGIKKENGGLFDLCGDNQEKLFDFSMQVKFDDKGNFLGVYDEETDSYMSPEKWNKTIESQWEEK